MYLSKLTLNPRHPLARRDLANPYELHSTLAWVFEAYPDERLLWRVERGLRGPGPVVLVQSRHAPPWDRLETRAEYRGYLLQEAQWKAYTLLERLAVGQVLRFRLEANPTVTRDGKRHGLLRPDQQLGWLERQGERHGFRLLYTQWPEGRMPNCRVTAVERRQFRKRQTGQVIVLLAVTFDGYLEVTDPVALSEAICQGLGHGKGLGLGLLSIAPAGAVA